MKIGIIADTHFGYLRFEEDSFNQAEYALMDASKKSDIIIIAGDVFDSKIPKMETFERVISILKKIEKPVIAIHGNHERRGRGMINALKILESAGLLTYLHNESKIFEINSKKINIIGLGNVPSDYIKISLEMLINKIPKIDGMDNVLILHQTINELSIGNYELSIEDINAVPYDLVINGHIHKKYQKQGSKLIIPGSTVITQLKEDETEKRGYFIFDTDKKSAEFEEIKSREFKLIKIIFNGEKIAQAEEKINQKIEEHCPDKITKIIISGKLKEGLTGRELNIKKQENLFIENNINSKTLKEKIELIRKAGTKKILLFDDAMRKIREETAGKISFDSDEFFQKLIEGIEKSELYLKEIKKI